MGPAEMMEIMLCGARDVDHVSSDFAEVVHDFAAEPWFYGKGRIYHINSATAKWDENSRATVSRADVCVFVVLERYGDITWNHELRTALDLGKPFVFLALQSSWTRYMNLFHSVNDHSQIASEDDRNLVGLLRMISSDYQITVGQFDYGSFKETLRRALSDLFRQGAALIQTRNRRSNTMELIGGTARLDRHQVDDLIDLVMDEGEENKNQRKSALRRLAAAGVRNEELVRSGCRSYEQGIQRLTFDLLPELLPDPEDEDLLRELATIAGTSDDVGLSRRLLLAVARVRPTLLDTLLEATGRTEEGLRRRAFEGVEENWDEVVNQWGPERTACFLNACEGRAAAGPRWIERLRQKRADLNVRGDMTADEPA